MSSEDQELQELLKNEEVNYNGKGKDYPSGRVDRAVSAQSEPGLAGANGEIDEKDRIGKHIQWSTHDNKIFVPTSKTKQKLTPGVYDIKQDPSIGTYFEKIPVSIDGLLKFPQSNMDTVVREIQKFWEREDVFRSYNLTFKRGILMWGPAGSGKSCTIKLITRDIIDRQGVVIRFTSPHLFLTGIRLLREVEPNTPVVVLMEDIDAIIERYCESEVLNILDGINEVDKMVFLATTNYPEKLGARVINRPSRFDKRFKIGFPDVQSRKIYLDYLFSDHLEEKAKHDLVQWVKDTDRFSLAHLKELFVAVVILDDAYESAIKTLSTMKELVASTDDEIKKKVGFGEAETTSPEDESKVKVGF